MRIQIIQIGKTKDSYMEEGLREYLKRLKPFASLEITTLKEVSPSKTFPVSRCIEEEGRQILKNVSEDAYVIALDEKGKEFGSVDFAGLLKGKFDVGTRIVFVIGGAFGLLGEVKERADLILSMSKMTFTHQMVRLFLLEQIYRSVCIIRGKEYHIA